MNEILEDFQVESKKLVVEMLEILNEIEGEFSLVQRLEEYGQKVDRIMGAAQSISMQLSADHFLNKVADYAAVCKAVGYKSAQIENNPGFFDICVALLLDGTEMLNDMIDNLVTEKPVDLAKILTVTFLDRLKWVSGQFNADVRATVGFTKGDKKMAQPHIDDLLKKLGI